MVDVAVSDLMVQLVNYKISKWKTDDEHDDQNNSAPTSVNSEHRPIRKLFVGNLSARTSSYDLRHLFRQYGKVVYAHVSRNKIAHPKKMFGFVTFKYPEDASSVLKLRHGELKLYSRALYVAPADSWHQPVELPDGRVLWKNHQYRSGKEMDSPETQTCDKAVTSSGRESASGDVKEFGAVGGCYLPSLIFTHGGDEQQQEEETKSETEGIETEEGECKIHMLNNDCLMHIFSFLTKRERIRIERVCKRWQVVCLDMWIYQKHLDFNSVFPSSSVSYLNMSILQSFLKRCRNLQSLDISHKPRDLNAAVLHIVAAFCKNLRCLNLAGLPVNSSGLRILSTISHELRVLNLDGCSGVHDKHLHGVFKGSPYLERVILARNSSLTGRCLRGLAHTPLKELVLDECNNLRSGYLMKGLLVLKNLSSLSLNSCINLSGSVVAGIIGAVPKLRSLSLSQYFPLFSTTALKALDQLHDLISLNLQLNPAVNDEIMDVITRSCLKIEELNITGCSCKSWEATCVTDAGLKSLAALPNLVALSMSYLANVSDIALEAIARRGKLRKLVCRGCPTFTDVGCISVVASCNELELFDFSGCDLVTNATVQAALESVKLRTNNIKLTLVVGATSVCKSDTVEKNPLLKVDFADLCVAHLRPDFVDDVYFAPSENEDYDDMDDICDWEWQCLSHAESDADPYDEFRDDSDISNNYYEDSYLYDEWD